MLSLVLQVMPSTSTTSIKVEHTQHTDSERAAYAEKASTTQHAQQHFY